MGIFSVDKGAKTRAMTYQHMQVDLKNQQRDVDFGRQLLSNIRQHRLASEQMRFDTYSDIGVSSSAAGGQANLASTLASEVGYAYDTGARQEKIQQYAQMEEDAWGEYYESVAKAQQATMAVAAVGAIAGGMFLAPMLAGGLTALGASATTAAVGGAMGGAAIGGLAGTGIGVAGGGGHVAGNAGLQQTLKSTLSAGVNAGASEVLKASEVASKSSAFIGGTREAAKTADTASRLSNIAGELGTYKSVYDTTQLTSSFGIWQSGQQITSNIPFSSVPLY